MTYYLYCMARSAKYFLLFLYTGSLNPLKKDNNSLVPQPDYSSQCWETSYDWLTGWSASSSVPYMSTRWLRSRSEIFRGNHGISPKSISWKLVKEKDNNNEANQKFYALTHSSFLCDIETAIKITETASGWETTRRGMWKFLSLFKRA